MNFLTKLFSRNSDTVTYQIVNRGDYTVVRRIYANGNIKSDRIATRRALSTLRTATHGRYFG